MVSKNISLLMLLFVSHSALPMAAGFTPNKELENAVKTYSIRKVKKILPAIPAFTQKECDYYQYILTNYGTVYGFKPSGGTSERLFYPFLFGTPVLIGLTGLFGLSSSMLKSYINDSDHSVYYRYALKALYYSSLLLTGASALTTVALPAAFTFHAYYSSVEEDISDMLEGHLTSNN
jgi:hypothetical protein